MGRSRADMLMVTENAFFGIEIKSDAAFALHQFRKRCKSEGAYANGNSMRNYSCMMRSLMRFYRLYCIIFCFVV